MITLLQRTASKRATVTYRCASQFVADPFAKYERPTPVVLLSGEGCASVIWSKLSDYLSKCGYGGTCLEYSVVGNSFEEKANLLHQEILLNKFTPPVLVAHSLSTFVAQKYLESYALSGLVLVNPIAPTAAPALANLNKNWNYSLKKARETPPTMSTTSISDPVLNYYGIETECSGSGNGIRPSTWVQSTFAESTSPVQPFFSSDELLQKYLRNSFQEDTRVNLERGAVPTMIVTTDGDNSIITPEELDALRLLHAVSPEDIVHFTSPVASRRQSRAPMITHAKQFNEHIFSWIEAVT